MSDLNLVKDDQTSWPALVDVLSQSFAAPRILPADHEKAQACLTQLQVTASSPLGAIALNSGGILLYDGWLRIYGGSPGPDVSLPSIGQVNDFPERIDRTWAPTGGLIVAHDVLGGVFFLNGLRRGAGRPGVPGEVLYFDPASLKWARLRMSHSEWLDWCVSGDLPHFYEGRLWPSWRADVLALRADQGIAVSPFLWSEESRALGSGIVRTVASMAAILGRQFEAARRKGRHIDRAFGRYPSTSPPS
ncbi:hypothetical protein FB565_006262 [Actinoplanes lutulentus]|uniref:Uncharacterized protein DUF2625 n=1 Tax=Actinoplanes lutulentus TaxID=1287878 RepID=A0A327Z2H3_9ACTN|nr:DUF2625 family protein [Actinoplanes lutulentus]MBB2946494.1 hypothetical protein [Actinoplanes lutulentus]RAK26412.1 uncharacterized protein DUF2625 [Actinoplanes lutulentus]